MSRAILSSCSAVTGLTCEGFSSSFNSCSLVTSSAICVLCSTVTSFRRSSSFCRRRCWVTEVILDLPILPNPIRCASVAIGDSCLSSSAREDVSTALFGLARIDSGVVRLLLHGGTAHGVFSCCCLDDSSSSFCSGRQEVLTRAPVGTSVSITPAKTKSSVVPVRPQLLVELA